MTRGEALRLAAQLLDSVGRLQYDGCAESSEAKALIARAKVEAAKGYVELAKELRQGT